VNITAEVARAKTGT